jgi:trehalose 6-phosphate synthase
MIVVSHRGPFTFSRDSDGTFVARRGAGGVVSALAPLLADRAGDTWIAATIGEDERAAVEAGAAAAPGDGIALRLLALDPHMHRLHYELVSNATLWFLHHGLFDRPRRPRFDHRFVEAWDAYVAVNQAFADAVTDVAGPEEIVLVQDYQLALTPGMVRSVRPDLHVVHFTHTPFSGPDDIRVLPDPVADALCRSMASGPAGFHTERWVGSYVASARATLGAGATIGPAFAASFGPDPATLAETAASPETATATTRLDEVAGDRAVVFRTDRVEPSKNIGRGFLAYERLLELHPEWRERVVFVAFLYASREGLPEYLAYRQEVEHIAARVNDRWATRGWQPIVLDTRDDYARSVAGLMRADVLLVNPIKDGLNLVAKEGPILSRRNSVLCLSREAGAFDELGEAALMVHPYDLDQTAAALRAALDMAPEERASRAARLRALAAARTPEVWLDELVSQARADG